MNATLQGPTEHAHKHFVLTFKTRKWMIFWSWTLVVIALPSDAYDVTNTEGLRQVFYILALLVLGILAFSCLAFLPKRKVTNLIHHSPFVLLYCIAIIVSQGTLLLRGDIGISELINGLGYLYVLLLVFFLVAPAVRFLDLEANWFKALIVVATVSTLLGILASFGATSFLGISLSRSNYMGFLELYSTNSFFRQRTAFGAVAILGCLGGLYFWGDKKQRFLAFSAIIFNSIGVFLSWGRSTWLGLAVAGIFWLYIRSKPTFKVAIVLLAALMALLLGYFVQTSAYFQQMVILDRGLSGRQVIWPIAIQAIQDQPLIGYGSGTSPVIKLALGWQELTQLQINTPSGFHNLFLDSAISSGLPATFFLIAIILTSIKRVITAHASLNLKSIYIAGIVSILIISFFTTYSLGGIRTTSLAFTFFLGLANVLPQLGDLGNKRD